MKLPNNALIQTVCLTFALGFSASNSLAAEMTAVINPESAVMNDAPETYSNDNWQSPATVEFNKLDKSGNGLLLPNEASKGKAFNKKTFKQADADNDGSIDVNEYVFFKTGIMPDTAKPASAPVVETPSAEAMPDMPSKAMPEATP
jgi:Ca2+-binding EF-hand superfamily protein